MSFVLMRAFQNVQKHVKCTICKKCNALWVKSKTVVKQKHFINGSFASYSFFLETIKCLYKFGHISIFPSLSGHKAAWVN